MPDIATFARHPGLDPGAIVQRCVSDRVTALAEGWTLNQVQGDEAFCGEGVHGY
jgi:hypothetical protein